ncbi:hypothetical protein MHYP_G00218090 [Metynnis hypsauchen]
MQANPNSRPNEAAAYNTAAVIGISTRCPYPSPPPSCEYLSNTERLVRTDSGFSGEEAPTPAPGLEGLPGFLITPLGSAGLEVVGCWGGGNQGLHIENQQGVLISGRHTHAIEEGG